MEWLKYYREQAGLSMQKLSELIGVKLNTIWRWETGKASPSVEIAKGLAKIFGITESELLHGPTLNNWELRLVVSKTNEGGRVDMTSSKSSAVLNISDDAMAITLSAGYELWEDDSAFEELISQLRRKRSIGLKTRREEW
ncbi:MAG: helix-turn-helix transcriptional regulator [Synergistaceae bacterium]|nr:helix-turn-helix transcriptional regulator [Synergistaceae bacterium]